MSYVRAQALFLVSALAGVSPGAWAAQRQSAIEGKDPVGVVTIEDKARECFGPPRYGSVEDCIPSQAPKILKKGVLNRLGDLLSEGREAILSDAINGDFDVHGDPEVANFGFQWGARLLMQDEILADPARVAVEQANRANPGYWIHHELALAPTIGTGWVDHSLGWIRHHILNGAIGGMSALRLVKRHAIQEFPPDFWGSTKRDIALAKSTLPYYRDILKMVTTKAIGDPAIAPGESVEVQAEALVRLAVSPNFQVNNLKIGSWASVESMVVPSFNFAWTPGYYRNTIERLDDHWLYVTLERGSGYRYSASLQAGPDVVIDPLIDVLIPMLKFEWWGHAHTWEHLYSFYVDTRVPNAKEALWRAWWNDWEPLTILASLNSKAIHTGVYTHAQINNADERLRFASTSFLGVNRFSSTSHIEEGDGSVCDTAGTDPDKPTFFTSCHDVDVVGDSSENDRKGWFAERHLQVGVRTFPLVKDPALDHSLTARFSFDGSHTKPDELMEVARIAAALAPPHHETSPRRTGEITASEQLRVLTSELVKKPPRRDMHAYVYMDFNEAGLAPVLSRGVTTDVENDFFDAWFNVTGYPEPAGWDSAPDSAAREALAKNAGWDKAMINHLRKTESFLSAAHASMRETDVRERARDFVIKLRSADLDLYPFAAVVKMAGGRYSMVVLRDTITRKGGAQAVSWVSMGDRYHFPSDKTLPAANFLHDSLANGL